MKPLNKYYSPTPKRWRKIGDAILLLGASLAPIIMGSPMNDHQKAWGVTISSLLGVFGKIATNFATDDNSINNDSDKSSSSN